MRNNVSHFQEVIMSATTTMVHVRINEQVKAQATEALASMGLSVSDAVRVFLTRIAAEKQLPFALRVPNAETRAAMAEADAIAAAHSARFASADDLFRELEKTGRQ
jgi:DNA-damage-inducible protein J